MDIDQALTLYTFKRKMCFFDEWLIYFTTLFLIYNGFYVLAGLVLSFGGLTVFTAYKNLEMIEVHFGINQYFLWPFKEKLEKALREKINPIFVKQI